MTGEEIHSTTLTFSVNVEKEEENGEPTEAGGGLGLVSLAWGSWVSAWGSWVSVWGPSSHFQDSQDVPGLQAVRPGAPSI